MKGTELFQEQIKTFIEEWALESEANLEAHSNKDKNLKDCVTYILNQVNKSGVNGFADQDIFNMAIEYYTTKDIKIGGEVKGRVVINRTVELTEQERQEAKEKAIREIINEEKAKARKKPSSKAKATPHKIDPKSKSLTSVEKAALKIQKSKAKEKEAPKQPTQSTLF